MAIIIPSSNTYSLDNNKVIDNKIDGVSYEQTSVVDKKRDLWTLASTGASAKTSTSNIYGEYSLLSSTQRQRVRVALTTDQRTITMSGYTEPTNMDWYKAYWQFTQNLTDNLTNTTSKNVFIAANYLGAIPKPPVADVGVDALKSYAKQLWKYGIDVNITEGTNPPAFVYCYSSIKLQIITETLTSGSWQQTSSETIYDTSATLYRGTSTEPAIKFYLDNSIDENSTITIGNEKSAFALPSNDLFTDTASILSKKLGDYVAEQIIENYNNGKETAEVLCSISNYYDELGNQVKFDNGEDMVFDIYDVVVPMKYTQNGEDVPISITTENNAKSFVVLGVEIFYDGAVWQRLTLAEYGYILSKQILKPNISIDNNLLYISSQDTRANNFDILVNGVVITNTAQTIFDLTTLALDYGTYSITVIAKANDYDDSLPSNSVNYTKLQKYYAPIISLSGSTLTITDIGAVAKSFEILVDNTFVANTTNTTYDLETLSLAVGSYSISVIAKADGYESSDISNIVNYVVVPQQLQSPSISIEGNTLTVTDHSSKAQQATIFINDIEADTVSIGDGSGIVNLNEYVRIVGEYSIYVIVKAETYIDSEISNIIEYVVYATEGLKYAVLADVTMCMGIGTATDTDIVISKMYNGSPVTKIYDSAFAGTFLSPSPLTSISIPNSVTTIATNAFAYCSNLTDIYVAWEANAVVGAPWGATNATIHYNAGYNNAN